MSSLLTSNIPINSNSISQCIKCGCRNVLFVEFNDNTKKYCGNCVIAVITDINDINAISSVNNGDSYNIKNVSRPIEKSTNQCIKKRKHDDKENVANIPISNSNSNSNESKISFKKVLGYGAAVVASVASVAAICSGYKIHQKSSELKKSCIDIVIDNDNNNCFLCKENVTNHSKPFSCVTCFAFIHQECNQKWIDNHKKNICPSCNRQDTVTLNTKS